MTILYTLLEITIYSAVIYCAIMLFKQVFHKNTSPVLIYMVWFLLIARLIIPVTPDAGFSFFTVPAQQIQAAATDTAAVSPEGSEPLINEDQIVSLPTGASPDTVPDQAANPARGNAGLLGDSASQTSLPSRSRAAGLTFDLPSILLLIWISGIALGIFHLSLASVRLKKRLLRRSISSLTGITALSETIKSELRLRADIKIVVLSDIASPALTAGFRPAVLIPLSLATQSAGQLEFALRHELMHYKRKDHIVCLLLAVLRAVYWFNPIVWLTARQMKMDMETACDSMVVASMSGDRKRSYANTILNMYAGEKKTRLLMGMALENTKKTAERRIRGIFMPSRSKRRTKAAAICLAAILLIACFTTACQPLTAAPGGIPTGSTSQPSAAPATQAAQHQAQSGSPNLSRYETPASYQDTFQANDSRVSININAEVSKPDAEQISVLQITRQEISLDLFQKAAGILMKGKALCEPRKAMSKAELQTQMDTLQKILDGLTVSGPVSLNPDPSANLDPASRLQFKIDDLKRLYPSAPDNYMPQEAALQFHDSAYYGPDSFNTSDHTVTGSEGGTVAEASAAAAPSPTPDANITGEGITGAGGDPINNNKLLIVQADLDGGYYGELGASNYTEGGVLQSSLYFNKNRFVDDNALWFTPDYNNPYTTCTFSQDEAYKMALDLLDELGITGMALNACRPSTFGYPDPQAKGVYGYYVQFVRSYSQIPLLSFSGDYNAYAQDYDRQTYESVEICIYEDQIMSFRWQSPSGPVQTIDQTPALLPFGQVTEIFKEKAAEAYGAEKLAQYYTDFAGSLGVTRDQIMEGFQSGQVNISKIEFGHVLTKDSASGSLRLVPAWKFYGSDQVAALADGVTVTGTGRVPASINTYMTISAIDGSVLDGITG